MNYRDELEIDLIEMLHFILSKWRQIVIFMLLGAFAVGAFSNLDLGFLSGGTDKVGIITQNEINEMRDELDDKLAEEVLLNIESYLVDKQKYEELKKQYQDSIRLKIDAEKKPTMTATYIISDFIKDEYVYMPEVSTADNIILMYSGALVNENVIKEIRKVTGYDVDESYIKELYSCSKSGLSMMDLTVNAPSMSECEAILRVLEEKIDSIQPSVSAMNNHTIQKVEENNFEQYDRDLLDEKAEIERKLLDYKKQFLTIPSSFTASQKAYYEAILDVYESKIGSETTKEAAQKDAKSEATEEAIVDNNTEISEDYNISDLVNQQRFYVKKTKSGINKKMVVLGAMIGAFIVMIWYCVRYVVSGTLRTENDLINSFKLSVYGRIVLRKEKRRKLFSSVDDYLDSLFNRNRPSFSEDESIDIVCSGISASAHKVNAKKLFLTGAGNDLLSSEYCERIAKACTEGNYNLGDCAIECGKNVVYDPRSLEKMVQSEGVVLIERIGTSRYSNIGAEIDTINKYGVNVLGAVVLE